MVEEPARTRTPSPWVVHKDSEGRGYEINAAPRDGEAAWTHHREVCRINNARNGVRRGQRVSYWEHPDNEGNAHLLAAAPELLEACKEAMKWTDRSGEGSSVTSAELFRMLQAAIAKAEGQSNG